MRRGPKTDLERQKRLGFPSRSKRQIQQILNGEVITHGPVIWKDHNAGKQIGTIVSSRRCKTYDVFETPQAAIDWWRDWRENYINDMYDQLIKDPVKRFASRHQMFLEMEYGVSYPNDKEKIALCESHSLWFPEERQWAIDAGKEIPVVKKCTSHSNGYPLTLNKNLMLKVVDGKIVVYVFDECEVVMEILKRSAEKFKSKEVPS